ncbi:MAG: hypothetical protein WCL50_14195 [Spirochaetota bacterium]
MDEKGLAILRQIMSDVEGAPSPGMMKDELYSIWFEHAQSVAQEALEYLNTVDPGHGRDYAEQVEFD